MRVVAIRPVLEGLVVLSMIFPFGCATTPIGRSDLLDFIKEGSTTREDILLKLGDPSGMYEGSRIITYRLSRDEGGFFCDFPRPPGMAM